MPDSSVKRLGRWLGIIEDPTWDPEEGDENTTEVYTDEVVYEPSTITSLEERRQVQNHGTGATAAQPGHRVTQQYSESDHAGANTSMGNTMGANTSIANPAAAPASMAAAEPQRVVTVHPRTYNEARTIGEHFRDGVPVIMNLSDMEDTDAKRLVDFAAGLIFGLRGRIERVTNKVFLLSPQNVTVSADDKERIASGSFYNQS